MIHLLHINYNYQKQWKHPQDQALITLSVQYAKDISFESPFSPLEFVNSKSPIKIEVSSLDVKVKGLEDDNFEVSIKISAKASNEDKVVYLAELEYAGVFLLKNVENDELKKQILLIHCPHLIFPYACRIISDLTRDGGYQPLMLGYIDFASLYLQQKNRAANENKGNGAIETSVDIQALTEAITPAPSAPPPPTPEKKKK